MNLIETFDDLLIYPLKGSTSHRCCVCRRMMCDCKETDECYCCKKCRRINVDSIPIELDGFSLIYETNLSGDS